MAEQSEERVARNEALFREANEGIEKGIWPDERGQLVPFRCECARIDCNQTLDLTAQEYEQVRANPSRFLVAPGHDLPGYEAVVERRARYSVVEKRGDAGAIAERLDPRA